MFQDRRGYVCRRCCGDSTACTAACTAAAAAAFCLAACQSAILGMHNITQRAMVVNGTIQPRPMMYIALTYDHRLIDGREVSMAD